MAAVAEPGQWVRCIRLGGAAGHLWAGGRLDKDVSAAAVEGRAYEVVRVKSDNEGCTVYELQIDGVRRWYVAKSFVACAAPAPVEPVRAAVPDAPAVEVEQAPAVTLGEWHQRKRSVTRRVCIERGRAVSTVAAAVLGELVEPVGPGRWPLLSMPSAVICERLGISADAYKRAARCLRGAGLIEQVSGGYPGHCAEYRALFDVEPL